MLDSNNIRRLLGAGQVEQAARACRSALAANDSNAEGWLLLAACEQRLGCGAEALDCLVRAAERAPDEPFRARAAEAMLALRAFETAWPVIGGLDFSRPQSVLMQARCRWGLGQHEAAADQLRTLVGFVPDWPQPAVSLARMLINLDAHAEAGDVLDTALARRPDDPTLVHQRTLLRISRDGPAAALEGLARHRPGSEPRFRELADALAIAAGHAPPDSAHHAGPRWEGFAEILATAAAPRWFGDNVALLKVAAERAPEAGVIVECGVFHGRTVNLLAGWLPGRRVFGFDSFEGLPETWSGREAAGSYSTAGRVPDVAANVELIRGWFADTLSGFAASLDAPIALLHIDCDLYSSTVDVLDALGSKLAPGAVVVFDEYVGYAGWRDHEHRAWREYRERESLTVGLELAQLLGKSAAFRIAAETT